jgi:hypothetical protein
MDDIEVRRLIEDASTAYSSRGMSSFEEWVKYHKTSSSEFPYIEKILERVKFENNYPSRRIFGSFDGFLKESMFKEIRALY